MSLSPEQLKQRLEVIGGSEAPALVGANPYMKPIDVWRSKREGRVLEDNFSMERGRFLEKGCADWWAHRRGANIKPGRTLRSKKHKHVGCTPDFLAQLDHGGEEVDLSIKVPGPWTEEHWGESGTDEAPLFAVLQLQYELGVLAETTGIRHGEIAAPIKGDLRVYPVTSDPTLQAMLFEAAERFWRDYVQTGKPPPPDSSESYADWLESRFPVECAPALPADAEAIAFAAQLREWRAAKDAAEEKVDQLRNALIAKMKDLGAEALEGPNFKILYRSTKGRPSTDYKALLAELNVPPELVAKHTHVTGYRQFRPIWAKESKP